MPQLRTASKHQPVRSTGATEHGGRFPGTLLRLTVPGTASLWTPLWTPLCSLAMLPASPPRTLPPTSPAPPRRRCHALCDTPPLAPHRSGRRRGRPSLHPALELAINLALVVILTHMGPQALCSQASNHLRWWLVSYVAVSRLPFVLPQPFRYAAVLQAASVLLTSTGINWSMCYYAYMGGQASSPSASPSASLPGLAMPTCAADAAAGAAECRVDATGAMPRGRLLAAIRAAAAVVSGRVLEPLMGSAACPAPPGSAAHPYAAAVPQLEAIWGLLDRAFEAVARAVGTMLAAPMPAVAPQVLLERRPARELGLCRCMTTLVFGHVVVCGVAPVALAYYWERRRRLEFLRVKAQAAAVTAMATAAIATAGTPITGAGDGQGQGDAGGGLFGLGGAAEMYGRPLLAVVLVLCCAAALALVWRAVFILMIWVLVAS